MVHRVFDPKLVHALEYALGRVLAGQLQLEGHVAILPALRAYNQASSTTRWPVLMERFESLFCGTLAMHNML